MRSLRLDFTFFDAVNGAEAACLHGLYRCPQDLPPVYEHRRKPISGRELACTLSHMRAIRDVWLRRPPGPLLVLEDDACFCTTDAALIAECLSRAPDDFAYLQLATSPARTVDALAAGFAAGGELFVAKAKPSRIETMRGEMGCHCAAAYLLSEGAMRAIAERGFVNGQVLLPCTQDQIASNVALVADRFVFHAATSGGSGRGYALAAPLATTNALDSFLHPDHVASHAQARDAAHRWSAILEPRLRERLKAGPP